MSNRVKRVKRATAKRTKTLGSIMSAEDVANRVKRRALTQDSLEFHLAMFQLRVVAAKTDMERARDETMNLVLSGATLLPHDHLKVDETAFAYRYVERILACLVNERDRRRQKHGTRRRLQKS